MPGGQNDRKYFRQYQTNRLLRPQSHARWSEGSGHGGATAIDLTNDVESDEGERLPSKRKRSSSPSPSAELQGNTAEQCSHEELERNVPIDRETASHDAQLRRLSNAQASKRSRTRLKTMKEELDQSLKTQRIAEERARQAKEQRLQAEERARQAKEQRLQAEERERQERERRLQAEAENKLLRQQLGYKK
ncbi:hypothetical protein E4U59_003467 [Claviceps monticola]|nr:hypothetical protein E4U59_003467 [Claviceps monticola]